MSFLSSFNISASALTAQRMRLDVASENIANIETTRTEGGGPYRRKLVVLEEIGNNTFRQALLAAQNNHETTYSNYINSLVGNGRYGEGSGDTAH